MTDPLFPCTRVELPMRRMEYLALGVTVHFTPNWTTMPDTKTASDLERDLAGQIAEVGPGHDDFASFSHLALDTQVWRDMGEPDVITVTVDPGDRLNDDYNTQPDMGPVSAVIHVPGPNPDDPAAIVHHTHQPAETDTRPQHDDVTNPDIVEGVPIPFDQPVDEPHA